MADLRLRTPEDVRRLFSALGDDLDHESGGLSVSQLDQMSLGGMDALEEVDLTGLGLSLMVAVATSWVAINAFQRNEGSMGWGLTWGGLSLMFPVPAVLYTAFNR
jgi:hypothetical protein